MADPSCKRCSTRAAIRDVGRGWTDEDFAHIERSLELVDVPAATDHPQLIAT